MNALELEGACIDVHTSTDTTHLCIIKTKVQNTKIQKQTKWFMNYVVRCEI